MGKYSNINAKSLQSNSKKALSELKSHDLSGVKSQLSNSNTLNTKAGSQLNSALVTITTSQSISGSIAKLQTYLNNINQAAGKIVEYQNIEREIRSLEARKYTYTTKGQQLNTSVVNQINAKNRQLANLERTIDGLLR